MAQHNSDTPILDKDLDTIIVVENIPQIDPKGEKMEKLENVLRKIFSRFGFIVNTYFAKENPGNNIILFGDQMI